MKAFTYLFMNNGNGKAPPLIRMQGDVDHLFKLFDLTVITEAEYWEIMARYPDDYALYRRHDARMAADSQRKPERRRRLADEQQPQLL